LPVEPLKICYTLHLAATIDMFRPA